MPTLSFLKKSPALLYGVVFALLLSASGYVGTIGGSQVQGYYGLVQCLSLGLGCLHLWLGNRLVPTLSSTFGRLGIVTLIILLLGMGITLIIYQQTGSLSDKWPFVSSLLPFVIPFLVVLAYRYYRQIPPANYRKWYYPVNGDMPDLDLLDLSKILVIQFEFLKTPADPNITNFKAKAPVAMNLGDLFLVFINDYNERTPASPIQYADAAGQPFGWVFTRKTNWWQRPVYLDPDLDFNRNQLADNTTIIALRASL